VDMEEALMGLERGGLFFGFVFLWDIFFVQREDFGDDQLEKIFPFLKFFQLRGT